MLRYFKTTIFSQAMALFVLLGFASVFSQGISIDLGKTITGRYLNLKGASVGSDGQIGTTFISPEHCAFNAGDQGLYMYFDIDNNYLYQINTEKFFVVNVEYYDTSATGEIQLQYDSQSNPYKICTTSIKPGGSRQWQSFSFFIDDAYFGGRQNYNADFRLIAPKGPMFINGVKVVPIDHYIDYGDTTSTTDEYGIKITRINGGDSKSKFVTYKGEPCLNIAAEKQYIYCGIVDSLIFNGNHPNVFVTVEYFDSLATGWFQLQYDSDIDKYQGAETVYGKGWGSWRTYTYEISNAKFANRENFSTDFRLRVGLPGTYINRIMIWKLDKAPMPTTSDIPNLTLYKALDAPSIDGDPTDWEWLRPLDLQPSFGASGKRSDEFYRTWLLDNENVPVAETGETGVTDPGQPGLWDTADLSGTFKTLWDDKKLYFVLNIQDNVLDVDGDHWTKKDGFGFYIDVSHDYAVVSGADAAVPRKDDLSFQQGEHFIFLPASNVDPGIWYHRTAQTGEPLSGQVEKQVKVTPSGYVLEVAVPLDLLRDGLTWNPGVIGNKDNFDPLFCFTVNDADNVSATSGRLMFGGSSADDEFWGRLIIEGLALVDRGVTIDFGSPNFEQFLKQVRLTLDGEIEIADVGGKKCAKAKGGSIYLDVDNEVVFNGNHPRLLVMIEYFDAPETEKFRLEYDAASETYKNGDWINVGGTQTWKTAILQLTDARFAGNQNDGADFRLVSPGKNLAVNSVRIGICDIVIDQGAVNIENGLKETYNQGDGIRAPAFAGGLDCKRNTIGESTGGRYFYFGASDSLIFNGNHPELFVTVEYLDTLSTDYINMDYDGSLFRHQAAQGRAYITGTNQWKLFSFYVDDAIFANNSFGGSDFRIAGFGDGYTYLNRISVGMMGEKTGVRGQTVPFVFNLNHNYPNPFNPTTTIRYEVGRSTDVTLKIFNVYGQQVRSLVNAKQAPGQYQVVWDGKDDMGFKVPSGLYIYRYSAGEYIRSFKLMLIK